MAGLLIALWTAAHAGPVELPEGGLTLRGHTASTQFAIDLPPAATGGTLHLPLAASAVVDRADSEVAVWLDDTLLVTTTLGQAAQRGGVEVPVPPGVSGRHHLTARTRLSHHTDACDTHEHPALWVNLLSTVVFDADASTWGSPAGVWPLNGRDVRIGADLPTDGPWLAAMLTADRWVRHQGGRPWWVSADEDPDLVLEQATSTQLMEHDGTLHVQGASADSLSDGLLGLMTLPAADVCASLPCELAASPALPPPTPSISPVAVRLADLGWQQGWDARGPGLHSLHLRWRTPKGWRLTDPAQLQGTLRLSGLDGQRAGLAVYVDGDRIHRSLLGDGVTHLAVDLPVPAETPATWRIELAVSLPLTQPQAHWQLEPDAGLHLSRNQGSPGGMISFTEGLQGGSSLLVSTEGALSPDEVGAMGATLAGLPPLRLTTASPPCEAPCVLATRSPDGGTFQRVDRNGHSYWEALTGSGTVLPAHGRPWVRLAAPGRLVMHLPGPDALLDTRLAPLPLRDIDSTGALAMGHTWFPVGYAPRTMGPDVTFTPLTRHDEAQRREAQMRSAYVDVAVAAAALLTLILLVLFWRNTSQRVPALEEL